MAADQVSKDKFEQLREKAEGLIRYLPEDAVTPTTDILSLIHELRIHQAELEIQNEELRRLQLELSGLYLQFEDLYEFAPCGYLNLDSKGIITRINLAGMTLLQDSRLKALRTDFSQFLHSGSQNLYLEALQKAGQSGEKQCLELKLKLTQGAPHWIWAEIQAHRGPNDKVEHWRMTLVDISSWVEADIRLRASEKKYQALFYDMVSAAMLIEIPAPDNLEDLVDARVLEVNAAFERMTRIPGHQAVDKLVSQLWPQPEESWSEVLKRALNTHQPIEVSGAGLKAQFLMSAFWVDERRIGVTFIDISAQKASQHALDQTRRVLESKVKAQTAELRSANLDLQKEVNARKQAQLGLEKKTAELETRSASLEEANAALKVLLKELKNERSTLEEQVVCNLNNLIRPYLSTIAAGDLSQRQRALLSVVNSNLDEIAAPMNRKLLIDGSHLTPVETQVADLIRQAKTTKEISEVLGVAKSTIDFHRLNIRRKLRLTHKQTNLQSYLRALE